MEVPVGHLRHGLADVSLSLSLSAPHGRSVDFPGFLELPRRVTRKAHDDQAGTLDFFSRWPPLARVRRTDKYKSSKCNIAET